MAGKSRTIRKDRARYPGVRTDPMKGEVLYIMTSLPAPGSLESPPPLSLQGLRERTAESSSTELVDAVLMSDDLLQREAFLAGEIEEIEPAVLTPGQVRDQEPLPEFLVAETAEDGATHRLPSDRILETYFRQVSELGHRRRCPLLREWVSYEVGLRNALVRARAKALGLDASGYVVAEDLATGEEMYEGVIGEWSSAPDPLAGLRVLDRARWAWLKRHERWYSFDVDELVAYAVRLMLVCRWERIRKAEPTVQTSP